MQRVSRMCVSVDTDGTIETRIDEYTDRMFGQDRYIQ